MDLALPWALMLLPVPVLAWFLLPAARERGALQVPGSVLAHLLQQSAASSGSRAARPVEMALKTIGWIALIIALAGPFVQRPAVLTPTGRDIVLAFDLSASMAEEDMQIGQRKLSRIDVIREKLAGFIRGRQGDRVALIGFATNAFLIAPPTYDVGAVAEMLDELTIGLPGRKTDLGQAIGLTVKMLREEDPGERMLILISDGEVNAGEIAATDAADMARDLGIKIFSIGFANEIATQNAVHMADLAERTGGTFQPATSAALMRDALSFLGSIAPTNPDETAAERRQDWRWLPLSIALICLLAIGWREYRDP
ncbi:MAG: VWA domain-containing protein [Paracoccaceae bacterium]